MVKFGKKNKNLVEEEVSFTSDKYAQAPRLSHNTWEGRMEIIRLGRGTKTD